MRGRAWRRYKQECKIRKRLNYILNFSQTIDCNDVSYTGRLSIRYFIGTYNYHMYKTFTTNKWNSKFKSKYSPNRNTLHRDVCKKGKRESDKIDFLKLLKLYGIR